MNWKKLGRRLLFPHPAVLLLICALAAALLVYSFIACSQTHPLSLAAYTLSAYALVLVCLRVPNIVRLVQRFLQENKYYLLYQGDVRLRVNLSLHCAFLFNAAYALFQLCLGLWHRSAFFYATAGYYLLLALMRLALVRHTRSHAPGEDAPREWRKYRLCGVCLLLMNLALMIFILYFVFRIRTFLHHEITTIAMAVYTFTSLTLAILNVIRYRKYESPAYSAAKAISLVSATVSMLTLENAMLTAFGQDSSETFRQIILGATGAVVILIVQTIAIYMIVKGNRMLRNADAQA